MEGESFQEDLLQAYCEVIRWKRNLFMVPSGKHGEAFVSELARLYRSYGEVINTRTSCTIGCNDNAILAASKTSCEV